VAWRQLRTRVCGGSSLEAKRNRRAVQSLIGWAEAWFRHSGCRQMNVGLELSMPSPKMPAASHVMRVARSESDGER
jgi:hypothetical protein